MKLVATLADTIPAHTIDSFHRGGFWLAQPAKGGHRAGMDAMVLAAAVPSSFGGRLADFGAGAGAAALAVLSRCPDASAVLVERAAEMTIFADATLAHPANAHIASRASVLRADVSLEASARKAVGLADNSFDYVIMNPPFNMGEDRATPDELRRQAHVMQDGLFESWVRNAAAVLKPGGGLAIIARPQSLQAILAALSRRFGNAELLALHPRADETAIRIVVRAVHGARGKLSIRPPLVLHGDDGHTFTRRADAVINGVTSLLED